jgi:hypothetical protein
VQCGFVEVRNRLDVSLGGAGVLKPHSPGRRKVCTRNAPFAFVHWMLRYSSQRHRAGHVRVNPAGCPAQPIAARMGSSRQVRTISAVLSCIGRNLAGAVTTVELADLLHVVRRERRLE